MGDGSLSQEEIDALLSMGDESGGGGGGGDDSGLDLGSLVGDSGGGGFSGAPGLGDDALSQLANSMQSVPGLGPSSGGSGGGSGGMGGISAPQGHREEKDSNVDLLLDVNLRFTVELGRTKMFIKDVLLLGEGSVVELDKAVGDEVDILINDRHFGRGKLIIMDEYFGVQITHIDDPLARFRMMGAK